MKELIKLANNTRHMDKIDEFKDEFGTTNIYGIKTSKRILRVWNSSNNSSFNHQEALKNIINSLLDNEEEGRFSDGWNEIMFEVIYNRT